MGLGLAIARKTAEFLGHQFDVTTGAHLGTCIRLYVPLGNTVRTTRISIHKCKPPELLVPMPCRRRSGAPAPEAL